MGTMVVEIEGQFFTIYPMPLNQKYFFYYYFQTHKLLKAIEVVLILNKG